MYSQSCEDVVRDMDSTKNVLDSADPNALKELHVLGHNSSKAISPKAAEVLEGLRSLSPQTGEHIMDRGNLRIVSDKGKTAWPCQAGLQKLPRDAK